VAPKLTKEQIDTAVAKLTTPARGHPERELRTDPHGSIERARSFFIETVRRLCPEFDASLLDAWPLTQAPDTKVRSGRRQITIDDQLRKWAGRWHLEAPWMLARARKVLERRYELVIESHFDKGWDNLERVILWLDQAWKFDAVLRPWRAPRPDPWNPDVQTELQYRDYIDDYIDHIRKQVEALGWVKPLQKRTSVHFEWLVRCQVLRESRMDIANIAASDYPNTGTAAIWVNIHRQIKTLASEISLPFQPSKT
jgi:hypothetical protein